MQNDIIAKEAELDSKQNNQALDDLFSKSTKEIVDGLVQAADGDHELALRNLEQYMNTHDGFNRNILTAHQQLQSKVESMKNSKFNKMNKYNFDEMIDKALLKLKEWTYDSEYDDGEWLDTGFAVKIIHGLITYDGNVGDDEPFNVDEYPDSSFYVGIDTKPSFCKYAFDEDLMDKDHMNFDIYTVMETEEEANSAMAEYQKLNPQAELQVVELFGYDDKWDEDKNKMIDAYGETHSYGDWESYLGDLGQEDY